MGAINVYPQEAENVLAVHSRARRGCIRDSPRGYGEEVMAVVQPAEGAVPGPALEAEVISWCRAHLATVK